MLQVNAKNLGNELILNLQGQIVNGETETLRRAVQLLRNTGSVTLDLAEVTAVDAHGLGTLLELRAGIIQSGNRLELVNVSQSLRRVFEITRLDTVFNITSHSEYFAAVPEPRLVVKSNRRAIHAM